MAQDTNFIGKEQSWEDVTPSWIRSQMQEFGFGENQRQLALQSGVAVASLNRWLNPDPDKSRPISGEGKKALWWYFKYLDTMRILEQLSE